MPIDIADFEYVIPMPKGCGKKSSNILIFLNKNKDKAFTYKEIAEGIHELEPKNLHGSLSCLLKKGKLRHKNPYWTISEESIIKNELTKNKKELEEIEV